MAYHYDHGEQRCIKGSNFISALWADEHCSTAMSMKVVVKERCPDNKKQQEVWKTVATKNEIFREMVGRLTRSRQIDYVLADSWRKPECQKGKIILDSCVILTSLPANTAYQ